MTALLALPLDADAQRPAKTARIGFLVSGPNPRTDVLRGLHELGWIEGQNIVVEQRLADGRANQLPAQAAELVRLKVDIIVTSSTPAALAAKQATSAIPIVVTFVIDPVGSGLVASLARPGGNITGVSTLSEGLIGKRFELLKEVVSASRPMAILWQPGVFEERTMRTMSEEAEAASRALGVQLQFVEVRRPEEIEQAFSAMRKARVGGLVVFPGPMLFGARRSIVARAADSRVPAVFPWREATDAGGLMSYTTNFSDMFRRAATYVDKILKGAKPADLPVEQPTKFELVVNLKTARALGITIPQSILLRADRVIE